MLRAMTTTANADFLRGRFGDRLLSVDPTTVLDVGCGEGALLDRCRAAGVRVTGFSAAIRPHDL